MKRFETFGEYMFSLLFAPLKKGRRAVNQLGVFFRVVGRIFDGMKRDAFRIREEASIATASPVMLPVHGQDRDMPRLEGEDIEAYRGRLSMKGIISEWGGTRQGILYALASLGYMQSDVQPFSLQNPERWAEFIVYMGKGNGRAVRDLVIVYQEIMRVKQASSKLAYLVYTDNAPIDCALRFGTVTASYLEIAINNADDLILVRDREFDLPLSLAPVVSSYSEYVLNRADDLILVRDRDFDVELRLAPIISSYREEQIQ